MNFENIEGLSKDKIEILYDDIFQSINIATWFNTYVPTFYFNSKSTCSNSWSSHMTIETCCLHSEQFILFTEDSMQKKCKAKCGDTIGCWWISSSWHSDVPCSNTTKTTSSGHDVALGACMNLR